VEWLLPLTAAFVLNEFDQGVVVIILSARRNQAMKRLIRIVIACTVLALPVVALAATWIIDPEHTSIEFKVRHMMISNVRGEFRKFSGTAELGDDGITTLQVQMTFDTATVDTGVEKRDNHLRSEDFLDVAKYPTMTYVSKKVQQKDDGKLKIHGELTLHGVAKEVAFDVEGPSPPIRDPKGNIRRGATATGKLNRRDFGINYNGVLDSGAAMVGEEVAVVVEVELVRK
jgi:polyisoprenoid-binding protein YceI